MLMLTPNDQLTQKELLRTFGYQVYDPTPQAFLSEFGLALPSVEELMRSANGTDSWLMVKSSMWDILSEAIHEPDFIRFPTSLLTCASFINALVNYLQFTQEYGGKNQLQPKTSRDRAEQRVLKVVDEMNTVMGFHPVRLT
ncbi:hypothetical protein FRC03_002829 [Tulasnella sp. 419]|nr:hypothetical protein FRC02_003191 [Tulasnella sp. 418]KAG8963574.1 hypothetical protein FRC03_002829 [Tulasnella sp. 419]